MGKSGFGLQMGKFDQLRTELWPLIVVKKSCPLSILSIFYLFSSNLAWELILGRSVLGLQMGKFCQNKLQCYGP